MSERMNLRSEEKTINGEKSHVFVKDIGKETLDIVNDIEENNESNKPEFAPEGYLTANDLAKSTGISWPTIKNRIDALRNNDSDETELFGKEYKKKKNGKTYVFYSPAEQRQIVDLLGSSITTDQAPEGYLTINGFAEKLGVTSRMIRKALNDINTNNDTSIIGSDFKTTNGHISTFYSLEEQQRIREQLEHEIIPEGYLTAYGLAEKIGVNGQTIKRRIDSINSSGFDKSPIVGKKFFLRNGKEAILYSPEEQEIIIGLLEDFMAVKRAPMGYLTADGLSKELGVSYAAIKSRINMIDEKLSGRQFGSRFKDERGNVAVFYSPEEQRRIMDLLDNLLTSEQAPEGYLTAAGLADKVGVAIQTVQKKIDELSTGFDEPQVNGKVFKNKLGHLADFYSPEEQNLIIEALERVAAGTSIPENAIAFYLEMAGCNMQQGYRPEWLKNPETGRNLELDIFVNPPGIGIEYDGWRYHQDVGRDIKKEQLAREHGCQIIHIRENGCPNLPEGSISIEREQNKKDNDLSECIRRCFKILNVPEPDIDVVRDKKDIMAFMRRKVLGKLDSARTLEELSVAS